MYQTITNNYVALRGLKKKKTRRSFDVLTTMVRFTNWKKRRKPRKRFVDTTKFMSASLFFLFLPQIRVTAINTKVFHRKESSHKKQLFHFLRQASQLVRKFRPRSFVSFNQMLRPSFKNQMFYLRHLEVNFFAQSFLLLPIPYTYFYSFLLDQTFLWKTLIIELHAAYRRR